MVKRTDDRGRAFKKSQLQIQTYVNRRSGDLNAAIRKALPSLDAAAKSMTWVSPLESETFREYCDLDFLKALGVANRQSRNGTALQDALSVLTDPLIPRLMGWGEL